ncbi:MULTISPECIES: hypothetical protein [unclassified Streptomyces]|uniref:hypothetical protein n=1 Tax=unclassified Streptomyces TaxID=2593676 RepID=UPI002E2C9E85|nr:hypothetical protein [Streptomyces sp. NBC_00223]
MAERDQEPVGALLDGLSAKARKSLAAAGFDLPRLRGLASTEQGERQVRHIVTEFGVVPAEGRLTTDSSPSLRKEVATGWGLVVLGAVVGLAAVLATTVLVDRPLGLLIAALGAGGMVFLVIRTPQSRGREAAVLLSLSAVAVLYFTSFLSAPQWYLAARGKQVAATLEPPSPAWAARGSRVAYCRVRLPDGSTRQVDQDDRTCAGDTGATVQVVYDPGGRLAPVLGAKRTLGRISRLVAAGAGIALLATAAGAVAAAGRRKDEP